MATVDEPELQIVVPAGATGWTPPAEDCLQRGGHYAWSLRAFTATGSSGWSEPLLFQVSAPPSDEELAQALEAVRGHFDVAGTTGKQDVRPPDQDGDQASAAVSVESPTPQPAAAPIPAGDPAAQIKVVGEVRTVAPNGTGRLWGRGRTTEVHGWNFLGADIPCVNGSINYGLSATAVEWGSAAEACPVGTWVCRQSDVIACNTTRPDGFVDAFNGCGGSNIDNAQNEHMGWVVEPSGNYRGTVVFENGNVGILAKCFLTPVWCCWE